MLQQRKSQVILAVGCGLTALMIGAAASTLRPSPGDSPRWMGFAQTEQALQNLDLGQDEDSAVLSLVAQSATERAEQLEAIARGEASPDRNRARFLLASDLIEQGQGGAAIDWLNNLEQDYTVLAPQILAKRAQAYTAMGETAKAGETWQALLRTYPESPISAEALYVLGQNDAQYWNQAMEKFPAHPRSVEIAQAQLNENPNQLAPLLLLARHGHYLPNIGSILERLQTEYAAQLQPEDWEAIAFVYWEKAYYGNAGAAYARAPRTSLNLYRTGRGAQLGERRLDAMTAYAQLVQEFPDAEETGLGMLHLARLTSNQEDALRYLDTLIAQFPDQAAEALLARASVLEQMQSPQSAAQARQSILSQHSQSDTAAQIRWQQAEQKSAAGDLRGAWDWARQIVTENSDSELAPEAAFWVGKWALQLGDQQKASAAFEHVLKHYPESYYAWRSATFLGWDVGDFTTVRQKMPEVVRPAQRPTPPAGSEALKELYRLGQDQVAWTLWQVEFENLKKPTVAEQFTDGLMRLGVNNNLDGIFMVSSLAWRSRADEKADYQALRQQPKYWQALYPFPFLEPIEAWSQQRQLNPMLVTALIRQESRFEPGIQSVVGATGLMQVMPETASWIAAQIDLVQYNMADPNDNIKLGTWYLDYTHREYANNSLFAVASYNAGPGSVADWIERFGFNDPDVFVRQIPFPETQGYVEHVFANYWNYLRLYNPAISRQLAQYSQEHAKVASAIAD